MLFYINYSYAMILSTITTVFSLFTVVVIYYVVADVDCVVEEACFLKV